MMKRSKYGLLLLFVLAAIPDVWAQDPPSPTQIALKDKDSYDFSTGEYWQFTRGDLYLTKDAEQAVGWHERKFEAGSLPSGVYFYRLEAGGLEQTRPMLLLR